MENYNLNNISQEDINRGSIDINKFVTSTASFQSLYDNTINDDSELLSEDEIYNRRNESSKKEFEMSKSKRNCLSIAPSDSKFIPNPELESKILGLTTEIAEKQDKIDHLEIKAKQAELYKEQNSNLK